MTRTPRTAYVYIIMHVDSGMIYVGKSCRPWKRKREHFSPNGSSSRHLASAIKKYGSEAFIFGVVGEFASEEEAYDEESRLIVLLRSTDPDFGYNFVPGGRGAFAHMPKSPEHRAKIGAAHRGRKLPPERVAKMRLVPQSAEKRAKLSAARKGRKMGPHDPARVAHRAAKCRGMKHTEEFKLTKSKQMKEIWKKKKEAGNYASPNRGKKWSEERRERSRVYNRWTEERRMEHKSDPKIIARLAAMSEANRGKKWSPELRAKIMAGRASAKAKRELVEK